jgi:hypothetical protein
MQQAMEGASTRRRDDKLTRLLALPIRLPSVPIRTSCASIPIPPARSTMSARPGIGKLAQTALGRREESSQPCHHAKISLCCGSQWALSFFMTQTGPTGLPISAATSTSRLTMTDPRRRRASALPTTLSANRAMTCVTISFVGCCWSAAHG